MKIYLKSNNKVLIDTDKLRMLGKPGNDGTVYEYEGKAIKILHPEKTKDIGMTEEKALKFKKEFRFRQALNIKDIVYTKNHSYTGYVTDYKEENFNKTIKMETFHFLQICEKMLYDVDLITSKKYHMVDFRLGNSICNEEVYPFDFDHFSHYNDEPDSFYDKSNKRDLYSFILELMKKIYQKIFEDNKEEYPNLIIGDRYDVIINNYLELFAENIITSGLIDSLCNELMNYETLDEYAKVRLNDFNLFAGKQYNK